MGASKNDSGRDEPLFAMRAHSAEVVLLIRLTAPTARSARNGHRAGDKFISRTPKVGRAAERAGAGAGAGGGGLVKNPVRIRTKKKKTRFIDTRFGLFASNAMFSYSVFEPLVTHENRSDQNDTIFLSIRLGFVRSDQN